MAKNSTTQPVSPALLDLVSMQQAAVARASTDEAAPAEEAWSTAGSVWVIRDPCCATYLYVLEGAGMDMLL